MCIGSTPDIPKPPPPPQPAVAPDASTFRKKRGAATGMGGGTILTSPSGVAGSALNTGGATLLGG